MRFFKKILLPSIVAASSLLCAFFSVAFATDNLINPCAASADPSVMSLSHIAIADELGWIQTNNNRCGGYYLEPAFTDASLFVNNKLIVTSNTGMYSSHGTSISEGKVT